MKQKIINTINKKFFNINNYSDEDITLIIDIIEILLNEEIHQYSLNDISKKVINMNIFNDQDIIELFNYYNYLIKVNNEYDTIIFHMKYVLCAIDFKSDNNTFQLGIAYNIINNNANAVINCQTYLLKILLNNSFDNPENLYNTTNENIILIKIERKKLLKIIDRYILKPSEENNDY